MLPPSPGALRPKDISCCRPASTEIAACPVALRAPATQTHLQRAVTSSPSPWPASTLEAENAKRLHPGEFDEGTLCVSRAECHSDKNPGCLLVLCPSPLHLP